MRPSSSLILLSLASCTTGTTTGTLATRADSAGVTIVTSTDPAWRDGEGWQISEAPLVQIGHRDDDDPHYDLLRIHAGRFLPDGRIVAAIGGSSQIRIFSSTGEWQHSIGRQGDGPGEFRFPATLALGGDTIHVVDRQLSRITSLLPDGTLLGTWPFPSEEGGGRVLPFWRLADGRWLSSREVSLGQGGPPTTGVSRPPTRWSLTSADLTTVEDSLFTLPGGERKVSITTGPGGTVTSVSLITLPISRNGIVTAAGNRVWAGDNESAELRHYTADGRLEQVVRWAAPGIAVDAALLERLKQARIAASSGTEQVLTGIEVIFAEPPPATRMPYFSNLFLAADGHLWVQEYDPFPRTPLHFRVFHPDGHFLGRLELPPRHRVLDIGTDRILTVWQDQDDLEYLRVYQLRR